VWPSWSVTVVSVADRVVAVGRRTAVLRVRVVRLGRQGGLTLS